MSTYVLIHGAWEGSWCWEKVVPLLKQAGYQVETFDLPELVRDILGSIGKPPLF